MKFPNKKLTYIVLGAIFILSIEVVWLVRRVNRVPEESGKVDQVSATSTEFYSKLDGTVVSSTEEIDPVVLGVMIDNHPDARPQSGLSAARVVYEVPVEGGLTRFFAIYNAGDTLKKVGPVRSARPYFLDWISEYGNSSYWHVGGSPEALTLIKQYGVNDVDEFYNSELFVRSKDRSAPHNVYTDSEKINKYLFGKKPSSWKGWIFENKLTENVSTTPVTKVDVIYSSNYKVGWQFDVLSGRFVRFLNNKRQIDESYNSLYGDTIVIQETDIKIIDDEGRRSMTTVGEGKARVLRDGKLIRATWKKANRESRTRFYDEKGDEVFFKPGKIWFEVVPNNTPIEMSS